MTRQATPGALRRGVAALAATLAVAAMTTATAEPATAAPRNPTTTGAASEKGPVGWDTYRDLDRLPELSSGVRTKQFSSFDRDGGNDDFWERPEQCQRTLGKQCVLAEHTGPGEIDAMWFTVNEGDVGEVGNLTITLDGKQVLHAPLQDIVDGKVGAPYSYPLVGNADQSSGGVYILVPMPFTRSMRVSTDSSAFYHHVTYRTFADTKGVSTFDPADPATDVLRTLQAAGTRDPKPPVPGADTATADVHLAPGESTTVASARGPGELTGLRLRLPQARYVKPNRVTDDGRAFGEDGSSTFTVAVDPANRGVRLTRRIDSQIGNQVGAVTVDGTPVGRWEPSPETPAGEWTDQSIELPASVTAGRSRITVRTTFVSSDLDFNEFTYWADSLVDGTGKRTDTVDVGDPASEAGHDYAITGQTFEGSRSNQYPLAPEQIATLRTARELLTGLRLRISFDGTRTVDAPVGEFFGSGSTVAPVSSLMFAVDPETSSYSAWWPMPYRSRATVTLYNGSAKTVTGAARVTSAFEPGTAAKLALGEVGYFRTSSHAGATKHDKDWNYLTATGTGKYVGNTVDMRGPSTRRYLEGDERIYPDGARSPQIHGTGTEDFYHSGWYFNRGSYTGPLHGSPAHQTPHSGCPAGDDCTSAYRLWLAEAVPFGQRLRVDIEHGDTDDVPGDYASTAYWYGRARPTLHRTDTLTVGDPASEAAHGYRSPDPGPVTPLDATFEGTDGPQQPVHAATRATGAPVTFTMRLDPANSGAVLTRQSDQRRGYQSARVRVNGQRLPDWTQPLRNRYHRWLDGTYQLPASVTAGRRSVTVTLTPNAGAPPWTAAEYRIASAGHRAGT